MNVKDALHVACLGNTLGRLNDIFPNALANIDRRSVQNHQQLANPTHVSEHFNLPGHSVNDIRLIPLELIHTNRDPVRKAREAHLTDKAKTLEPQGLNRRDELH